MANNEDSKRDYTRLKMLLDFIIAMTGIAGGTVVFVLFMLIISSH